MKAVSCVVFTMFMAFVAGCGSDPAGVDINQRPKVSLNRLAVPTFGIYGMDGSVISAMGPNAAGWSGTIQSLREYDRLNFFRAKAAGYQTIIGNITRDSILFGNWTSVKSQIAFGKANGVRLFFIDDAQSDQGANKVIGKDAINFVASLVHAGTYGELILQEWNLTMMQSNPSYYQNVDIIMPYQFGASTASQYASFMQSVRALFPYKKIIPELGYHADIEGDLKGFYASQTGTPGTGHIEIARQYASTGIVFYYCYYTPLDSTTALTEYLQAYYQMGSTSGTITP